MLVTACHTLLRALLLRGVSARTHADRMRVYILSRVHIRVVCKRTTLVHEYACMGKHKHAWPQMACYE